MIERYRNQVRLLLRVLPVVAEVKEFALKGGTAINFFWREFPRLSVDIDLTFVPVRDREASLRDIQSGVETIAEGVSRRIPGAAVTFQQSGGTTSRLIIRDGSAQIKLEVNTVLRGVVFDPVERELSPGIQDEFELFAAIHTLSLEDLYGGKLCAALDRQHPRDLYDVKLLLEHEGVTPGIRTAFIGYLISHSRPMHELLDPNAIDLKAIYQREFDGMTNVPVPLEELVEVQRSLPRLLLGELSDDEKEFLRTFQRADPQWDLMPVAHLKELPGVRWKLLNIGKMNKDKHDETGRRLHRVLQSTTR